MSIHRVGRAHFERFVTGNKDFVERPDISAKAKLFLMWMTSHSDSYRIHVTTMTKLFKEGKSAIYEGLKELAALGFMCKYQPRINGRMGATHYLVSVEALTAEQWQEEIDAIDWYRLEGVERLEPTASRKSESGDTADEITASRFSASGNSASGRSDTKKENTKTTNDKNKNHHHISNNQSENINAGEGDWRSTLTVDQVIKELEVYELVNPAEVAGKFLNYNNSTGWQTEGGKDIKDWRQWLIGFMKIEYPESFAPVSSNY